MTDDRDFKDRVRERMAATGQCYTAARTDLDAERAAAARHHERTLQTFFDGPRLRNIPTKRKARLIVLLELLARFEAGREYPEREINEVLREAHEDVAYLRRELVDYGYLRRRDGVYTVADHPPVRDPHIVQEAPADEAARFWAAVRRPAR